MLRQGLAHNRRGKEVMGHTQITMPILALMAGKRAITDARSKIACLMKSRDFETTFLAEISEKK